MVEVREGGGRSRRHQVQPPPTSTHLHNVSAHSTVTLFAKLRGRSTSHPRSTAIWYARSCSSSVVSTGDRSGAVAGTRNKCSANPRSSPFPWVVTRSEERRV